MDRKKTSETREGVKVFVFGGTSHLRGWRLDLQPGDPLMVRSLNKALLIGNLGSDPEIGTQELIMLGGRQSGSVGTSEAAQDDRRRPVPARQPKAGRRAPRKTVPPDDDMPF